MNHKRKKSRRQVRCTLCTPHRWLGNATGRMKRRDELARLDRRRGGKPEVVVTNAQQLLDSLTKAQRDHVCGMAVFNPARNYRIHVKPGMLWVEQDNKRRGILPSEVRRKLENAQ